MELCPLPPLYKSHRFSPPSPALNMTKSITSLMSDRPYTGMQVDSQADHLSQHLSSWHIERLGTRSYWCQLLGSFTGGGGTVNGIDCVGRRGEEMLMLCFSQSGSPSINDTFCMYHRFFESCINSKSGHRLKPLEKMFAGYEIYLLWHCAIVFTVWIEQKAMRAWMWTVLRFLLLIHKEVSDFWTHFVYVFF